MLFIVLGKVILVQFSQVNLVLTVYFDCTFSDWAQPTPLPTS